MLHNFKKNTIGLLAPVTGRAVELSLVPDEVFSSGMLGVGFAVEPTEGEFFSPCDGVVESVSETLHAYSIASDAGLDVLVHIGIDTVKLCGKGFSSLVRSGQRVKKGQALARVDLDLIRARGLYTVTPVIVTNADVLTSFELSLGRVSGGESLVMHCKS